MTYYIVFHKAYIAYAVLIAAGAALGICDWRWLRGPWFGLLLIIGIIGGGFIVPKISPFNFADGGYALQGFLAAAGSAIALGGYVVAAIVQFAHRQIRSRRGL